MNLKQMLKLKEGVTVSNCSENVKGEANKLPAKT